MEPVIESYDDNGLSYTKINGTLGTLCEVDVRVLVLHAQQLHENAKYVETGSYLGCSSLIIALHSNATVYAHDIWTTEWAELNGFPPPEVKDYFYEFYKSVKTNKMENRIIPIRGNSTYTLGIHDDESIDLAFIDGDHSYEGCLGDLRSVWSKMKPGGSILVHDCSIDSVLQALKQFTHEKNIDSVQFFENSCGMMKITV